MNSIEFARENPRITIGAARQLLKEHDIGEDWITFAFTDHPEAIYPKQGTVDTETLLLWMGY